MEGLVGPLEVLIDSPAGVDAGADLVICHPHPLHGGTMHNKVVHTLARAARDEGVRAVRFNFRGVGRSAGTHDQGAGEVDDLLAVVDGLARDAGRPCLLAGFSFGAWVAAAAAARLAADGRPPRALLLVAPPVFYPGFATLPALPLPVEVFMGDQDEVVDPDEVYRWVAVTPSAPHLRRFPATHFFHGQLPALKAATAEWLKASLSRTVGGQ